MCFLISGEGSESNGLEESSAPRKQLSPSQMDKHQPLVKQSSLTDRVGVVLSLLKVKLWIISYINAFMLFQLNVCSGREKRKNTIIYQSKRVHRSQLGKCC